jgi:hypothetical protein
MQIPLSPELDGSNASMTLQDINCKESDFVTQGTFGAEGTV